MTKPFSRRKLIAASPALGIAAIAPKAFAEGTTSSETNPLLTVSPRSKRLQAWLMPAHFGMPEWQLEEGLPPGTGRHDDVTQISIAYLTDQQKLESYLPRPYELEGPPILTVVYSMNRDCSWLAGGGYNLISVTTRANYPGKVDNVSGSYALVFWENLTEAILAGRELQGIPKIYGEIDNHRVFKNTWRTALSNHGKTMLEMEAADLKAMPPAVFEEFKAKYAQMNLLGWKCIPNETRAAPLLSYATAYPFSVRYREAWSAKGKLKWHPRTWEELPTQAHIVNALHGLPLKEIVSCTVCKASVTLHFARVRRLA